MNNVDERETCAHGPCDCMAPREGEYCSTYCENADSVGGTEIGCGCGHQGCG